MKHELTPPGWNGHPATSTLGRLGGLLSRASALVASALLGAFTFGTHASTAYGSLNNFDCVNDTGVEAHGFEIELDDIHSRDITYTYDYNHYGVPRITEDNTDPLHPKVFVRYAANRLPTGAWSAYTAVPAGPILPTDGHQFTNPSINFGGEHYGVGYYGAPTAVRYNWLIDDGTGNLVHGPAVYVSTPTFVYYPPAPAQPVAQVQAVVVPPPPPAPPVLQFGVANWVKDIKTTTHNNGKVELVDLVSEDLADPSARNWANGEPAEVETEWRILQTEFADAANPKGELKGLPEDLPGGDEVVTRRYEFYKYVGPIDAESGEAMADSVGPDGIHGVGSVTYIDSFDALGEPVEVTVDLSTVVVVGEFFGAQMSGFDIAPALGLIDHVPDGEVNVPYAERTIVIGGGAAFLATLSGDLPDGMSFDPVTGILAGTPTVSGVFTFTVDAADTGNASVSKTYTLTINGDPAPPAVTYTIATSASPALGGATSGDGVYNSGDGVVVVAAANAGYSFVNWTEGGAIVSASASYSFVASADRALVANFAPITYAIGTSASPVAGGLTSGDGVYNSGINVTVVATANAGYAFVNWTEGGAIVSASASYSFAASADRALVANFAPITYTISTSASPVAGGLTNGDGIYNSGANVTVVATANAGYSFVNWTEGGAIVSASASYTFAATADRALVANFAPITYAIGTSASPSTGGLTSGDGIYNSGANVTVAATANAGYAFVNWTEGGAVVSASASYSFAASADRALVANFAPVPPVNQGVTIKSLRLDSTVRGGESVHGEVWLSGPAPAGGLRILLASSNGALLRVPVSVFIPAGRKSAAFEARTTRTQRPVAVEVSATLGDSRKAQQVRIVPHHEHD